MLNKCNADYYDDRVKDCPAGEITVRFGMCIYVCEQEDEREQVSGAQVGRLYLGIMEGVLFAPQKSQQMNGVELRGGRYGSRAIRH